MTAARSNAISPMAQGAAARVLRHMLVDGRREGGRER